MRPYGKVDLNAPRYREKRMSVYNPEFYQRLLKEHPELKGLSYGEVKAIINKFSELIYKTASETREGVELPEQMGYILLGTCQKKKSPNPDRLKSKEYGVEVTNQNWESDQYLLKIFYTNYESKYNFKFHHLWGFQPCRLFKRYASSCYREEWKKYLVVENYLRISRVFRKSKMIDYSNKRTQESLKDYDEFDMS